MSEIVVTQKDLGSIIETYRGDVIVLRLGENLTTGYRWEVKTEGSVVELIESNMSRLRGRHWAAAERGSCASWRSLPEARRSA